jgi:hypothetical protein
MNPKANPAGTVDGGIPSLFRIGRTWPAATDPHRSAEAPLRGIMFV